MKRIATAFALIATTAVAAPAFAEGAGYFDTIVANGNPDIMSTQSGITEFAPVENSSFDRIAPVNPTDFSAGAQGTARFLPGQNI